MIQRAKVAGSVEEGETARYDRKRCGMQFEFRNLKKARSNFKFILVLLLVLYVSTFASISLITPIAELYGSKGETIYTGISLQTHIIIHNHLLQMQQHQSAHSESNAQPDCSSLINDVGRNTTSGRDSRGIMCCDRTHFRTDVCYLSGDVRTHSQSASIFLDSPNNETAANIVYSPTQEKIRPYTRKWEENLMNTIDEITLKRPSPEVAEKQQQTSSCQVRHSVPAVVFSTGGYTGNVYHEFNDGLLPLYITSQHLQGEVVFVILEYHEWWMSKYGEIVKQLTNYPVINFSKDQRVHCFPEMIVGLKIHDELSINPALMKEGKSIVDFRALIGESYAPRLRAMPATDGNASDTLKPKLVIISRRNSRVMMNENRIVKLANKIGFQVEILNPQKNTEMVDIFRVLNSCDVMVGVHGAAMTHFLFMRPASVFIQIVPLGTHWAAATYYGEPATKLGLKYMEYKILPEESSLFEKYERNDPVLTDPESINSKGWRETKKVYLDGQNVKPSVKRFRKTLRTAYEYAYARRHGNLSSLHR